MSEADAMRQTTARQDAARQDAVRQGMREIDFVLHSSWRLGKTIVAGWTHDGNKASFCFSEPYMVLGSAEELPRLIRGRRLMDAAAFSETCKLLRARPLTMDLPFTVGSGKGEVNPLQIETLVKRYTISATESRAVILFDIVSFSKHTPLEQVAQLSSLEYSINSASKRLNQAGLRTELARSTVGDGFYVWNRAEGAEADLRSWLALLLILADNALARQKGNAKLVPTLRAAFTIGSHFSYHQVEGTTPRGFEYIVGEVTITLARIIAKALPGQILIGQFLRDLGGTAGNIETFGFLARAEQIAATLSGLEVGHATLLGLRGRTTSPGDKSGPTVYRIGDKHGYTHQAFNARVTVDRENCEPLMLGLPSAELAGFAAEPAPYDAKAAPKH
jgi:class 3 adenylate cyclase